MSCARFTKEQADALWSAAKQQQEDRARLMPDMDAALMLMVEAHNRLRELGWREAMYCPKDGTSFEVIEAGSGGIHVCHYHGEWPNGWWISADGDLWPSHPILWRPLTKAGS